MREITGLMITAQDIPDSELCELVVVACDDYKDIFKTTGFDSIPECWEYARMIQYSLGLPDGAVECDVNETDPEPPKIYRIK